MKADAYGHGLGLLMPVVVRLGIPAVGITDNAEARVARACGFQGRLIRMRVAGPGEIEEGFEYGLEEMLGNLDNAREMSALAGRRSRTLGYHLALNSGGMSRYGLEMADGAGKSEALAILGLPHLRIAGIMTHFPVRTRQDILGGFQAFRKEAGWIIEQGGLDRRRITLHCANSFATLNVPEARLDMVRSGGVLYKPLSSGPTEGTGFKSIAQFKSRVASVNSYPAGNTVSYDRTFTLARPSRLASVPVGYSDGYRCLSLSRSSVLIQGRRVQVVGKGTMNTIMVDVTDHPGTRPGDEVVLFGRQGNAEIPLDEFAKNLDCPNWEEMATSIGNQNPKVLLE
jgi:alanine racemase